MRMRLIGFSCALALIALALVPMLPPSRALTNAPEKIDPALQTMMTARPLALLPVIVEMQPPTASVGNVDRANQALDLLRLNGAAAVGLPLLGSAAGFANAAGIDAMSLVPTVAYIHYDATVVPDVVVPDAASNRALDPVHHTQPQGPAHLGMLHCAPPSTQSTDPVVNDDAALARYSAAPTISPASPARRSANVSVRRASSSVSQSRAMLVRKGPGMIAFTRTVGPNASANPTVIALTPAFAAA